ncbi:MAG: acyl-CoA desaturase [Steroidobacteraceae bacterium]
MLSKISNWLNPLKVKDPNWITKLALVVFHIGAVLALFNFTWTGFWFAVVLWWLTIGLGIGFGYHRLLTHRAYKVPKWLEYTVTVLGTMTLEGGPIFWVGTHRLHHKYTDQAGDPHSPRDGRWWSHMGWIVNGTAMNGDTTKLAPHVPDLVNNKFHVWISKYHWVPLTVFGFTILAIYGWPVTLWAIFLRVTLGLHFTWLVNSACHLWGSQRFATGEDSRNNWWVSILTFGEGWHNNHHAHAQSARHGLMWWEIDLTWYTVKVLSWVGLVTDIRLPRKDSKVQEIGGVLPAAALVPVAMRSERA